MGGYHSNLVPMSVDTNFKEDAQEPWCTADGPIQLSLWISPNTMMTVEDLAVFLEQFIAETVARRLNHTPGTGKVDHQATINTMTFRGKTINRSEMVQHAAKDYLHDRERFTFLMTQTVKVCCVIV